MLSSAQTSSVSKDSDALRMIRAVAVAALASVVCLLLLGALPPRLLQPEWLIDLGSSMLGFGPTLLMASLAIRLTLLLKQQPEGFQRWRQRSRMLAMVLCLAFAAWIPLQLISAERILQRQSQQEGNIIRAARRTADAIAAAGDLNSFRSALARVVQAQTIPQTFDQPLNQLKTSTLANLESTIQRTLKEQKQARSARRQAFWIEALRNAGSAALLCLALAVIARS